MKLKSQVLKCCLGWADADTGPNNTRLYALDKGTAPRWASPHARTAETALEHYGAREGDLCLVVVLGDRFTPDARVEAITNLLERVLAGLEALPPQIPAFSTREQVDQAVAQIEEAGLLPPLTVDTDEVTHATPPEGSSIMPCCFRNPLEVSRTDRMTNDPDSVTCK